MSTLPPPENPGVSGDSNAAESGRGDTAAQHGAAAEQPTSQPPQAADPAPQPAAPAEAAQPVPQQPTAPQPPAAPQPPQYQAPPAGAYQQPAHQAPQQPQYQAPPAGGYQPPQQPGYQQPQTVADPVSNITLNYWLSVFFGWIPALIFLLIDKDKGNPRLHQMNAANMNFTLLRIFAIAAAYVLWFILIFIPYIGAFLGGLILFVAWVGGFVLHILAAVKAPEAYRTGQPVDPFLFNLPMIK
ncbi:MAG: DUF4870 domain-containing protein [Leucobacter sp.]